MTDEELARQYWESVCSGWNSLEGRRHYTESTDMWGLLVFAARDWGGVNRGWIYYRKLLCHHMPMDPQKAVPEGFLAAWRVFLARYGYSLAEVREVGDAVYMRIDPVCWPPPLDPATGQPVIRQLGLEL